MARRIGKFLLSLALLFAAVPATAQEQKKAPEPLALERGAVAPDFTLLHYDGTSVKLSSTSRTPLFPSDTRKPEGTRPPKRCP